MTDWHTRIQRTQHLVRAFARMGFPCLYVNPHLGREFETSPLFDKEHRLSQLEDNVFELHVRLPREPVFHDRLLTTGEEEIVAAAIRRVLPERSSVIQILSFPLWRGVARKFRSQAGFPIVYDCHDLLSGFRNIRQVLVAAEDRLLREADLVLFSSQGLADRYASAAANWLLVHNAVDAAQFQRRDSAQPPGPPIAGYVGALEDWFDIEAVEQAAAANPQCRIVLAGRVEFQPVHRLAVLPNVELIGEIPYSRVPELLSQFHVALIPFRINPLTLMTNPIKLYEYFSCGLPVVSTPLPEAQSVVAPGKVPAPGDTPAPGTATGGELVYLGSTPAEFARQVQRALAEDDSSLRARRREIAARESWMSRAQSIGAEFPALLRGTSRSSYRALPDSFPHFPQILP